MNPLEDWMRTHPRTACYLIAVTTLTLVLAMADLIVSVVGGLAS